MSTGHNSETGTLTGMWAIFLASIKRRWTSGSVRLQNTYISKHFLYHFEYFTLLFFF